MQAILIVLFFKHLVVNDQMRRPQNAHRSFFPFGNPFRIIAAKSSQLSPRLVSLLIVFEENLAERLKKLNPENKDDVLSLTWMKSAMEALCETHTDVKTLITDLELPVTDWNEKWIDVYLDISVKLLDICIAFSSEITRLNQGHLLLYCGLHNLESNTSERYMRACSSLDKWRHHISLKNPRVQNVFTILHRLVESIDLPKVKNSAKGKVLMRAMYGVKVETMFVCSILAAAFSVSSKNLLDLEIPDTVLWSQAYSALQSNVNGRIKDMSSDERFTMLKELDSVDALVKKVSPMIQDGLEPTEEETIQNSISELKKASEELSRGLDFLSKEVDGFFKIVLTGRDALLCNLRANANVTDPMVGHNVEEQAVK
ncbi:hypothetical protein K2173_025415 [Erythroxylum novogranatense]|uniref:BPS1-like protein n=1 Tax=Erythroxylum novogranatense TaxID=1862640 RepID=A0AAV8UHT1_9ROSI|nr:hypothetical protein K2173_025415 [Erythroxylum novogranatense]